jgi:hypothetical protein
MKALREQGIVPSRRRSSVHVAKSRHPTMEARPLAAESKTGGAGLPQAGRYPRGSEAVADLRGAIVPLDRLLVGKPLRCQEAGECGHWAAVAEEPGRKEPVGARSRPSPSHREPAEGRGAESVVLSLHLSL